MAHRDQRHRFTQGRSGKLETTKEGSLVLASRCHQDGNLPNVGLMTTYKHCYSSRVAVFGDGEYPSPCHHCQLDRDVHIV